MNSSGAALIALRAFRRRSSLTDLNNTWAISRSFASGKGPTTTIKSSGASASGAGSAGGVKVEGKNLEPPSNVFKQVDKSALGPGASKQSDYKNPEYFSYHNMSYSEMEIVMARHRVPQPSNKK